MYAVLKKSLRDSRNIILALGIGLGLYAIMVISFYPAMVEQSAELNDLLESYPEAMIKAFYGDEDISELDLTEPGGFVHSQFTAFVILILGALLIAQIFAGFNSAERDGTLDVMLSLPISRRQYFLARLTSSIIMVLVALTTSFLGFAIASLIWPEFDVSIGRLAIGIYGGFFPLLVIIGFTYLLATVIPSSKRIAGAIAYLFLIGAYLLYTLVLAIQSLEWVKPLILYHYYNAGKLIRNGIDLKSWVILSIVALVYIGVAWWRVDYKEIGV